MTRERAILDDVANDYRTRGYRVVVEPGVDAVPEFLRDFRPDLVAESEHENVVVEVKLQGDREPRHRLRALAETLRDHPGWRLRVLLAEQNASESEEVSRPVSPAEIINELQSVSALKGAGHKAAAFLVLWSLFEAAARNRLLDLGVERSVPQAPTALAKDLVAHGLFSEASYDDILAWASIRNTVAHGNPTRAIPDEAFTGLLGLVQSLASEPEG